MFSYRVSCILVFLQGQLSTCSENKDPFVCLCLVICSHVHYYFYSSHATYTKMCRLLLIDKILVPSHYIRAYIYMMSQHSKSLWCHRYLCDIIMSIVCCWCCHGTIGGSVTSSCPLFAAGVVMTPLLMSLTTTKCSWQQMANPSIVGICNAIS